MDTAIQSPSRTGQAQYNAQRCQAVPWSCADSNGSRALCRNHPVDNPLLKEIALPATYTFRCVFAKHEMSAQLAGRGAQHLLAPLHHGVGVIDPVPDAKARLFKLGPHNIFSIEKVD
jgi:hypothetical protein